MHVQNIDKDLEEVFLVTKKQQEFCIMETAQLAF